MTTFMGVPAASDAPGGVTILGAPFDYSPDDPGLGPHIGPEAIRAASTRILPARIDSDLDPLRELDVRDGGDVDARPGDPPGGSASLSDAITAVVARGSVPLVLGGDGSVVLAVLRALSQEVGAVAVIHLDAHTDCNPPGEGINEGSSAFWIAAAEGLVAPTASVHVGLRGPGLNANSVRLCEELGYRTVGMDRIVDSGTLAVLDQIREIVGDRPTHLCWDLDAFDPSVAPGVFSPSWGGLGAAVGLRLVRGLAGLRLVGADVNNLDPPADINGLTASLAAQLAFELLFSLPR
ncbi:MAG: arginase family protein [Actinobacteria bacterium]|nr:arginase family protein [Actinomycetota bacterium]